MAKQLADMLTDLRAEVGHSTNVAHGVNDRETLIYYLNRTQIRLIPGIRLAAAHHPSGQPACPRDSSSTPTRADLAFDDISYVWLFAPAAERSLLRHRPAEWPSPTPTRAADLAHPQVDAQCRPKHVRGLAGAGHLKRQCQPVPAPVGDQDVTKMVNDSDVSTLPDNLIVLYAAAEILARDGPRTPNSSSTRPTRRCAGTGSARGP
jgi:hypothetical protein